MKISGRLDFTRIDTPQEALVLPGADVVASLILQDSFSGGSVCVKSDADRIDYKADANCDTIKGVANEQAIELKAEYPTSMQATLKGKIGENEVCLTQDTTYDGFKISGRMGDIQLEETLRKDPLYPYTPHYASITGVVGGQTYTADINAQWDGSYRITGKLGELEINETLKNGCCGTRIEGNLAGVPVQQTIQTT